MIDFGYGPDWRIDTFSCGAGHPSRGRCQLCSWVRVTHIPSGLTVECNQHDSHHQNRWAATNAIPAVAVSRWIFAAGNKE